MERTKVDVVLADDIASTNTVNNIEKTCQIITDYGKGQKHTTIVKEIQKGPDENAKFILFDDNKTYKLNDDAHGTNSSNGQISPRFDSQLAILKHASLEKARNNRSDFSKEKVAIADHRGSLQTKIPHTPIDALIMSKKKHSQLSVLS